MAQITIYTDGSALGNPGPGGYGAVLLSGHHRKELSQGFRLTTNNRMELMGVCVALETLKFEGSEVVIYSDSKYVVDAVTKGWVFGWVRKGFAGKKNPDLWMRFLRAYNRHNVRFVWVKGHADTVENNRCDKLAVAAANDRTHWLEDTGYDPTERGRKRRRSFFLLLRAQTFAEISCESPPAGLPFPAPEPLRPPYPGPSRPQPGFGAVNSFSYLWLRRRYFRSAKCK